MEYRTGAGRRVRVGTVIGKGGEGTVSRIEGDNSLAAKVYTDGKQREREEKITAMVAKELHKISNLVAFPIDTLLGDRGDFVGFTMRRVDGFRPVHELYGPGSRKAHFPKADYRFLVRAALNISRAIATVHRTGCVIGDINHSGILVDERATITLIDADSFQFQLGEIVYKCRVGVAEYTPPEIQKVPLQKVIRRQSHDNFGLAVVAFQLLFMGKHPYAGRYSGQGEMPIEKAIGEGRFAYSVQRRSVTRMDPPPFALSLGDLNYEVQAAFERAFDADANRYEARPTAAEWVEVLSRLESDLVACITSATHFFSKYASSCPWCSIESASGATLFPSVHSSQASVPRDDFDLSLAISALHRIPAPDPVPDPTHTILERPRLIRSSLAAKAQSARVLRKLTALAIAGICIVLAANGWPVALLGLFLAAPLALSSDETTKGLLETRSRAEREWDEALKEWNLLASPDMFVRIRDQMLALASEYHSIRDLERQEFEKLVQNRRDTQLHRFLLGYRLVGATITGIGSARKAALASWGIESAADVSYASVKQIPGFGDTLTRTLLSWRRDIESRFVFDPSLGPDPTAIQQLKHRFAARRATIEQSLLKGPVELERLHGQVMAARRIAPPRLINAYRAFLQAKLDLD
jgi:DNA-binding helix-hairpin-helix protein with protein kinase domain